MCQFPNKSALSHISADFFHTFNVVTAAHKEKIKIRQAFALETIPDLWFAIYIYYRRARNVSEAWKGI